MSRTRLRVRCLVRRPSASRAADERRPVGLNTYLRLRCLARSLTVGQRSRHFRKEGEIARNGQRGTTAMNSAALGRKSQFGKTVRRLRDLGMLGVLTSVVSVPVLIAVDGWRETLRMYESWTISGPACPVVTVSVDEIPSFRPPKSFTYAGVDFTRRFGHVFCVSVPAPRGAVDKFARVCQFSAPDAVTVQTASEDITFRPGVARIATVKVVDGRADCVVAGWFKG